jgi:lambda family phage portal protein
MGMNLLEKAIATLSPEWASKRLASKLLIEQYQAYDASKPGRTRRTQVRNVSGDTAIHGHAESIRGQARYLDENHDIVTGILNTLEQKVVGPKGISIEPMPYTAAGEKAEELATQISKLWEVFSIAPDTTGEYSREEMERLVCRSWLRDGECFGKHVIGNVPNFKHNTSIPFSLELLESDYLPFSKTDLDNRMFQGIEKNNWGQPLAYHFYKNHPGDMRRLSYGRVNLMTAETIRVPAERVQHLKYVDRLRQGRGISILHAVITRLEDLKDYEESERVAARISAVLAAYIKKSGGHHGNHNGGDRTISMAPGAVFDGLMPGEDVGTIQSNRPSALLQPFRDSMLRAVASGTRGTFSTISGQFDGNYSSQRQEMVEGYAGYETLQRMFITKWSKPIYRKFIDVVISAGLLNVPADVEMDSIYNALYFGPVMPWIDPDKESKSHERNVKAGFSTESEVIRKRGQNPQEVKAQRAKEVERNKELDLIFSSDARHETQQTEIIEQPAD